MFRRRLLPLLVVALVVAGIGILAAGFTSMRSGASAVTGSGASLTTVVNKQHPLSPIDYEPTDLTRVDVAYASEEAPRLRREAASAVERMFAAFHEETGEVMLSRSAYRSHDDQADTYARFESALGSEAVDETTARPGYSEHQTGLAIDVGSDDATCASRDCFAATVQAQWLAKSAWEYGFIIRYPAGQASVTGYSYEPWHLRYLGTDLAKTIHFGYGSLEEYYGLPAASDY